MELILMKNIKKTPKEIEMSMVMEISETMKNSFSKNYFPSDRLMFL